MVTARARAGVGGFAFLAGVGCSDGGGPHPCGGTFEATYEATSSEVAPPPDLAFSGCSFYVVAGTFTVTMSDGLTRVISVAAGSQRLGVGTHTIGTHSTTNPPPIFATLTLAALSSPVYFSESGTLTVTESTPGQFKGSLAMTAKDRSVPPVTATITATFDATCSPGSVSC